MSKSNNFLIIVFGIVLVSSGCTGILDSESSTDSTELVKEGNILNYQSNGEDFEIVFSNETEEYIDMSIAGQGITESTRIRKSNWTSIDNYGSADELFFSALLVDISDDKVERLMSDGEEINVTRYSTNSTLSRSEIDYKGLQAYNITITGSDEAVSLLVHVERPYLFLKSPEGFEYFSMNKTNSPESYISNVSSSPDNSDTAREIGKAKSTELTISPVYAKGSGSKEEMLLTVSNTGQRAIDVSKFSIMFGPPNYDPVSYPVIKSQAPSWAVGGDGNQCFTSEMKSQDSSESDSLLEPGDRASCSTGVRFPDALETMDIKVLANDFDYTTTYECAVQTQGAKSC